MLKRIKNQRKRGESSYKFAFFANFTGFAPNGSALFKKGTSLAKFPVCSERAGRGKNKLCTLQFVFLLPLGPNFLLFLGRLNLNRRAKVCVLFAIPILCHLHNVLGFLIIEIESKNAFFQMKKIYVSQI